MKISYIVPVYNVEAYIEQCLASIQNQTLADFECLVVDDGSPDRSSEIAKEKFGGDPRFVFLHKENGGLSDARNFGLQRAGGDYVCFVDSDDSIALDLGAKCVAYAQEKQCDIVCFDMLYVYDDGRKAVTSAGGDCSLTSFAENEKLLWWNNSANNKIYRRSFLNGKEFIQGIWYEDLATVPLWMAQAQRVGYIPEAFYCYLQREGSISHSADPRVFDIYFALRNIREHVPVKEEIFAKLVLDNGLLMTQIRIRAMKGKRKRMSFYERNLRELNRILPSWYAYTKKEKYHWKQRIVFALLKMEAFSLLERLTRR